MLLYSNSSRVYKHVKAEVSFDPNKADILAMHVFPGMSAGEVALTVKSVITKPEKTIIWRTGYPAGVIEQVSEYNPRVYDNFTEYILAVSKADKEYKGATIETLLGTFENKTSDYNQLCSRVRSDMKLMSLFTIVTALEHIGDSQEMDTNLYRKARDFVKTSLLPCMKADSEFEETKSNYLAALAVVKGRELTVTETNPALEEYAESVLCGTEDRVKARAKRLAMIAAIS